MNNTSAHSYVLAIDLGTGGPKVGLVDEGGRIVASAVEHTDIIFLPGDGAEQDPEAWWQSVSKAARKVIRQAGAPRESILAVSCTSQWSVIVPVDENGEALMNAIHWMDNRGAPYNQAISRGFPNVEGYALGKLLKWIRLTGMVPTHSGVDSLGHILFIKNERPDIYSRTHKFLEPMDYLNLRLTGRIAASQITVFPMIQTDCRDPDNLDYHPWLLQVSGVDREKLPELLPVDATLGTVTASVAEDWGLSPQTVVLMSANDNHTAAIGGGAIADFDAVAVLGTSGFLACHLPFKKSDLFHLLTTIPSPFRGRHLILAELGNTGKVLDSYLHHMVYGEDEFGLGATPDDLYARANQIAGQAPPGSEGVLFLPWFNGSLAPSEDKFMRGGFLNLSHKTSRAHMTRAVLEGTAFNWKWLLGPVEKFIGRRFEFLRLSGGGAQSDVWAQIMADVLGVAVHQLADPLNANVRGAAFLAFHRLGLINIEAVPRMVEVARIFEPSGNYSLYRKMFEQFLESYRRTRPIFHALNR